MLYVTLSNYPAVIEPGWDRREVVVGVPAMEKISNAAANSLTKRGMCINISPEASLKIRATRADPA